MSENLDSRDHRYEYAAAFEDQGKYAEAIEQWRTLSLDSNDAGILCRLGSLAEQLGYIEEAERAFREAIQMDDKESSAYVGLATVLMRSDEWEDACGLLQKALSIEKNEYTLTMLGVALNRVGKEQEAINSLEAALRLDPGFEEAYFNLGIIKRKTDTVAAENLFMKALEIDPMYADAHRELGWLLTKQEDFNRAEYHLRRAIELKPEDGWARIYHGNFLWKKRDLAGAVPEFECAITLLPNRAIGFLSLANVYEEQEHWGEAETLYERAIEVEPDDPVAHMNFGRMLGSRGNLDGAKAQLGLALLLDPDYSAARDLLTRLEKKRGIGLIG